MRHDRAFRATRTAVVALLACLTATMARASVEAVPAEAIAATSNAAAPKTKTAPRATTPTPTPTPTPAVVPAPPPAPVAKPAPVAAAPAPRAAAAAPLVQAGAGSVPTAGTFGIGANLAGAPGNDAALVENGLQLMYWIDDRVDVLGRFGLVTVENAGTQFFFAAGLNYYFVKKPVESYGIFVAGELGLKIIAPPGNGDTQTQFALLLGPGAEYYFSRHFAAQLTEGLQFSTNPLAFAFVSRIGLNWYF